MFVMFHGCLQNTDEIGTAVVTNTGLLEVAESNDIVVLFPQVQKSEYIPFNPKGCWDWWGYGDVNLNPLAATDFATKLGG